MNESPNEASLSTAFDFDLQLDSEFVSLFDDNVVNSPDSYISTTSSSSCEAEKSQESSTGETPSAYAVGHNKQYNDLQESDNINFEFGTYNEGFNFLCPNVNQKQQQSIPTGIQTKENKRNDPLGDFIVSQQYASANADQQWKDFGLGGEGVTLKKKEDQYFSHPQSNQQQQQYCPPPKQQQQQQFPNRTPSFSHPFVNMNIQSFNVMNQNFPFSQLSPVHFSDGNNNIVNNVNNGSHKNNSGTQKTTSSTSTPEPLNVESDTTSPEERRKQRKTKRRRGGTKAEEEEEESGKGEGSFVEKEEPVDKEIKRRIKNRESAQASRERKKLYVEGLEKKLSVMCSNNTTLSNQISYLEEENMKLRERLKRLERGEDPSTLPPLEDSPSAKKRRMAGPAKLPLPPANSSTYNPLNPEFWQHMYASYNAFVNNQPIPNSFAKPKVILFVILLCVAMMVTFPKTKNGHISDLLSSLNEEPTKLTVGRNLCGVNHTDTDSKNHHPSKRALAASKKVSPSGDTSTVKIGVNTFATSIEQAFNELNSVKFQGDDHIIHDEFLDASDDEQIDFKVRMDYSKNSLVIDLPGSWKNDESTLENSGKLVTVSKKLLKDICTHLE